MGDGTPSSGRIALVTVSYRGDRPLLMELCESLDRHLDPDIEHIVLVPRSEISLFEDLARPGRRVLCKEDVLPPGYRKLPVPYELRVPGLFRRRIREMWWSPSGPMRGWLVQQIVKLCAPTYTDREIIVFADSDMALVRPVTEATFMTDGRPRLYRVPDETSDSPDHLRWHRASARLLGLPATDYFGADYIGNLPVWRREVVLDLYRAVETIGGKRWDHVISGEKHFAEYILYGVFAEHVLGDDSGQTPTATDLVHSSWRYDLQDPAGMAAFIGGLAPHHVGVAVQSTQQFSVTARRELLRSVMEAAPGPT